MGKMAGVFFTCLGILLVFDFILSASGLVDIPIFSLWGLVGLLVTVMPVIILLSVSVEFHILGSGGSTGGLGNQTIRILFTVISLLVIFVKIDLPAPIPFDIGLGLGTDILAIFSVNDLGGIPFLLVLGIVIAAIVSGVMVSVEGG